MTHVSGPFRRRYAEPIEVSGSCERRASTRPPGEVPTLPSRPAAAPTPEGPWPCGGAGYHAVMRRAQVIALLSAKREEIAERFGVRSLSIFGSTARDEARPDSDVDVLVEFVGPVTFDAHMGLLVYLEDLLGRRVDVVTASGLKSRLRPLIEQDLVRVA